MSCFLPFIVPFFSQLIFFHLNCYRPSTILWISWPPTQIQHCHLEHSIGNIYSNEPMQQQGEKNSLFRLYDQILMLIFICYMTVHDSGYLSPQSESNNATLHALLVTYIIHQCKYRVIKVVLQPFSVGNF